MIVIAHGAHMRQLRSTAVFFASALCIMAPAGIAHAKDLGKYGKVNADLRIRYERVDEENRPREGVAKTARLRLGYETPEWNGLLAYGEVETIRHLGATSFDDGLNGKSAYGRIQDPELTDLAQLYAQYTFAKDSIVRLGRQPIALDNQRFVSWSKTRQNDSVHDAALFKYVPVEDLTMTYAYSIASRRFSGHRSTAGSLEGDLNLANIHYDWEHGIGVSAYSYWLNFDGIISEENLSSRTHGIRATWEPKGEGWQPLAAVEYARQSAFGHSALDYDENYFLVEAGAINDGLKISATIEQLGGDGVNAMQTPVGSGHNLTGWTDKFSTIPANGLRDMRIGLVVPYDLPWEGQSIEFAAQYHHFESDDGDINYGQEGDISLTYKPIKNHSIQLKYGDYHADEFPADTQKLWLTYEFKF